MFDVGYENAFPYVAFSLVFISLLSFIGISRFNRYNYVSKVKHELTEEDIHIDDYSVFFDNALLSNNKMNSRELSEAIDGNDNFDWSVKSDLKKSFDIIKEKGGSEILCKFHFVLTKLSYESIRDIDRYISLLKNRSFTVKNIDKILTEEIARSL